EPRCGAVSRPRRSLPFSDGRHGRTASICLSIGNSSSRARESLPNRQGQNNEGRLTSDGRPVSVSPSALAPCPWIGPLLIDSGHKRWFFITFALGFALTALYVWLDRRTPGGLTGGSRVGLCYGILGSALMVFAGLLSGLRRVPSWWWIGSRTAWLKGHIWLGLLSG